MKRLAIKGVQNQQEEKHLSWKEKFSSLILHSNSGQSQISILAFLCISNVNESRNYFLNTILLHIRLNQIDWLNNKNRLMYYVHNDNMNNNDNSNGGKMKKINSHLNSST